MSASVYIFLREHNLSARASILPASALFCFALRAEDGDKLVCCELVAYAQMHNITRHVPSHHPIRDVLVDFW